MQLVLRVVKAAGAGPAIRAAEHGARPMPVIDPAQFAGEPLEGIVPRHRHKFVAAAALVGSRAAIRPTPVSPRQAVKAAVNSSPCGD